MLREVVAGEPPRAADRVLLADTHVKLGEPAGDGVAQQQDGANLMFGEEGRRYDRVEVRRRRLASDTKIPGVDERKPRGVVLERVADAVGERRPHRPPHAEFLPLGSHEVGALGQIRKERGGAALDHPDDGEVGRTRMPRNPLRPRHGSFVAALIDARDGF